MERNWDTVRELLLSVESHDAKSDITLNDFPKENHQVVSYHVELLAQANLLDVTISNTLSREPKQFFIRGLTWDGHEFLDAIREKSVWEKTKSTIYNRGGVMTVGVIQSVAIDIAKKVLGL